MEELITTMCTGLVDDPASINVTKDEPNEEGVTVYHLRVAADDMGRVIGKQGKIANAIRTIVKTTAMRQGFKAVVEIND